MINPMRKAAVSRLGRLRSLPLPIFVEVRDLGRVPRASAVPILEGQSAARRKSNVWRLFLGTGLPENSGNGQNPTGISTMSGAIGPEKDDESPILKLFPNF